MLKICKQLCICDLYRLRLIWGIENVLIALENPGEYFVFICVSCRVQTETLPQALTQRPPTPVGDCVQTAPLFNICNLVSSVAGRARRSHLRIRQQTTHSSEVTPHKSVGHETTAALTMYWGCRWKMCGNYIPDIP
jgi:hypothetical protein